MSASNDFTEQTVRAWLQEPVHLPAQGPARVGELVHETPQQRHWWPTFRPRGSRSMFTPFKLVLAGVLVALFGALLLPGVLPPPSERAAAPAAVDAGDPAASTEPVPSASPEATREVYESTARLVVDAGPDPTDQDLAVAETAAVRYAEQAESRAVVQAVIEELELDDSPERLTERISTSTDVLLLSISVRDDDARTAHDIARVLGNELVDRVMDPPITPEIRAADNAIARNEAAIKTLTNRLRVLRQKQNKDAADRSEIIALTGQISALQSDNQSLLSNSRATVRNRLSWFERPSVPEQPMQDDGPEARSAEPDSTTEAAADTTSESEVMDSTTTEPRSSEKAIVWDASSMRIEADAIVIEANGQVSNAPTEPDRYEEDVVEVGFRQIEAWWREDGEQRHLQVWLRADDTHWWISRIFTHDGAKPMGYVRYRGLKEVTRTPRGESFEGDLVLEPDHARRQRLLEAASLRIDGLRLTAFSPNWGPERPWRLP